MSNKVLLFFEESSKRVERFLDRELKVYSEYTKLLTEGMRYSVFAGGKRLRPALVYASYGMFSDELDDVTPIAAAVEVLHTYSLIHDDLPAMDNDDYRRGRLSNHKVYGEAEAILAGDALLSKSFEILSDISNGEKLDYSKRLRALYELSVSSGINGMVGGQYADIKSEGMEPDASLVEFIHENKTSALIECSIVMGGIAGGCNDEELRLLSSFGRKAGLAFQIVDDILDITSTSEVLGKSVNKDISSKKMTYPYVYSLELAGQKAEQYIQEGILLLDSFGIRSDMLKSIAKFILERKS